MANNPISWIWSPVHQNHYYVTFDAYNKPVYHWSEQSQANGNSLRRMDSVMSNTPIPQNIRDQEGFISGTPETGWYDQLDQSYVMRTGAGARGFFVVGRVFAMLYTENASETSEYDWNNDAYTVVRFGGVAYTTIRRFVVVEVRRGFVNACGIGTYSGRGTLKPGCGPKEHAIVYFSGTDPATCYIPGEYEGGMDKEPIQIDPANMALSLRRDSRIRFSKTYPIEMNVKIKDIGLVKPEYRSLLLQYWGEER
ncbi:hypothetical protein T440DRAFT_492506 [Plenodomus tracheiphilus IPT5]|uniref:DUF6590 domain-containing protein n=1 Tax=Plenodomus tracheiphilus IPT5 TaxID=1408161 RepID=A0A6A7AXI5_9PLEO|nr:hypothetical protein T440DRAFT_492506 [Plenodomus tracheiphilus IPT5]